MCAVRISWIAVALSIGFGLHAEAKPVAAPAPTVEAPRSLLGRIQQRGVLRVGMCVGLLPFVVEGAAVDELLGHFAGDPPPVLTLADGRRIAGFDVELATELGRALGVKVEVVLVSSFDALLPGLAAGEYDVVASGLTRTLERAQKVAFTEPYFSSGIEILVRDATRHDTLAKLNVAASRVAFRRATTAETLAARKLPQATRVPIDTRDAIYAAMDDPQIDAVVVDTLVARDAQVRKRSKATLWPLEDRRYSTEHIALALPLGDPDWLGFLNLFLREAKSQGAFHRAAARYNAWFRTER